MTKPGPATLLRAKRIGWQQDTSDSGLAAEPAMWLWRLDVQLYAALGCGLPSQESRFERDTLLLHPEDQINHF